MLIQVNHLKEPGPNLPSSSKLQQCECSLALLNPVLAQTHFPALLKTAVCPLWLSLCPLCPSEWCWRRHCSNPDTGAGSGGLEYSACEVKALPHGGLHSRILPILLVYAVSGSEGEGQKFVLRDGWACPVAPGAGNMWVIERKQGPDACSVMSAFLSPENSPWSCSLNINKDFSKFWKSSKFYRFYA